jgi:hypothetical protein
LTKEEIKAIRGFDEVGLWKNIPKTNKNQ